MCLLVAVLIFFFFCLLIYCEEMQDSWNLKRQLFLGQKERWEKEKIGGHNYEYVTLSNYPFRLSGVKNKFVMEE